MSIAVSTCVFKPRSSCGRRAGVLFLYLQIRAGVCVNACVLVGARKLGACGNFNFLIVKIAIFGHFYWANLTRVYYFNIPGPRNKAFL